MKRHLLLILVVFALALPGLANENETVTVTEAERKMAESITAKQLKEYLYFVASDEMGGRDTPSVGLDLTAKFMAMMLSRWGFTPAGDDNTFFQKMMVREESFDSSKMKLSIGEDDLEYMDDFFVLDGTGSASGDLVFAKDGWFVKSRSLDPYDGIDVAGKIVVIYNEGFRGRGFSPPPGITSDDLSGEQGVDWDDPVSHAKAKGAKAVLLIASPEVMGFWGRLRNFLGRGGTSIEGLQGNSGESIPLMLISDKVGKSVFSESGRDHTSKSAFEIGTSAELAAASNVKRTPTQNVVAIWEGSDPELKHEMVALGAHYDHVGTRPNAQGDDKIWNGADDDGSGTVAVLAIAEALAKAPVRPKRSILLVWHAGEEKGLLGAAYFNKYPTVDIKNVVAQLNIDMIGRTKKAGDTDRRNADLTGPNEVYVIGTEMMSTTLGNITKETNGAYLNMRYNYKYADPKDPNRFFFRSDHFMYARNGIPVVFWFTGTHEDYHGAGDHADKIDYEKMESIARTIFLTSWELAQLDKRPAVDKPLDPSLIR